MVIPPRPGLAATGRRDLANRAWVASRCRATIRSQAAAAPSSYCSISTPVVVVSWPARYGGARREASPDGGNGGWERRWDLRAPGAGGRLDPTQRPAGRPLQ